jgi:hypothetical protein
VGRVRGKDIHLGSSIESACYTKCFPYAVDAVCECSRIVLVFEADFSGAETISADYDG